MTTARTDAQHRSLRLWPGIVALAVQWLCWQVVPLLATGLVAGYTMLGGVLLGGLAVIVWWLFFSRAAWIERVGAVAAMVATAYLAWRLLHESIAGGMMGFMFWLFAIPTLCLTFVAWAVATRNLPDRTRRITMVAAIALGCGAWTLVRTGGMSGEGTPDFALRWSKTPEQRLLEAQGLDPSPRRAAPAAPGAAEWPGFRGAARDGVARGVRIATDWSASPPVELWRKPVGPAWSSFAIDGDRVYTQEQRGESEVVSCYDARTGEQIWSHDDAARFWESNAGAGPRGTPTLHDGRVYTLGATGILNALDADDGAVEWSRNAASDTQKKVPGWGFAGSPLVVDDLVVVATAGVLAAYDRATGEPRWVGSTKGWGYSSPHLATIGGLPQIVLLNGAGAIGVAPADGTVLWQHEWSGDGIVQPALTADGDVLIGSGSGLGGEVGVHRIAVAPGAGGWTAEERWTSIGLKPYFNDFVVHEGHAYGFDGSLLACIELEGGQRRWKGGRYGSGQLVLLPDQDLLLVLSEQGELALVAAAPDQFTELARVPGIEGKTWNHPALVGDLLLVRNAEEMAAFRLPHGRG